MAIQKETAAKLRLLGEHYVTIPALSIELIQQSEALAIWVYLLSKSEGWIVRRDDLSKRFDLGDFKLRRALKHLRDIGLLWDELDRDETGAIVGKIIVCSSKPIDEKSDLNVDRQQVGTMMLATHNVAEPHCCSPTHLPNDQDIPNDQKTITDEDCEKAFEYFWSKYPKKVDKPKAKKRLISIIKKQKTKDRASDLINKIVKNIAMRIACGEWHPEDSRKQFICGPDRFLLNEKWEETVEVLPQHSQR